MINKIEKIRKIHYYSPQCFHVAHTHLKALLLYFRWHGLFPPVLEKSILIINHLYILYNVISASCYSCITQKRRIFNFLTNFTSYVIPCKKLGQCPLLGPVVWKGYSTFTHQPLTLAVNLLYFLLSPYT